MWVAEGLHNTQVMAYTKGREMAGTCKYCGFSGTNDDLMEHAGEDCRSKTPDAWRWKMKWCKENGLAPAKEEVWVKATEEYLKQL